MAIIAKLRFDKSGYYFIGLAFIIFAGFWNSYFSRFFSGNNDYSFYFHFHAAMALLWLSMLIIQPILIRRKDLPLHKTLGKLSYVLMPVLLISVLLVLNSVLKAAPVEFQTFSGVLVVVRDLLLLGVSFGIAVWYRRNMPIHARAMVITGIVFIEPALARLMGGVIFKGHGSVGFIVTASLIVALLITLIICERKQKSGRWLFPSLLAVYLVAYTLIFSEAKLGFLDGLIRWYARLPLT
ncbi:MAG: hypothetical protein QM802_06860 [Agriterribacter sp.]